VSIAVADFNLDGKLDLAVACAGDRHHRFRPPLLIARYSPENLPMREWGLTVGAKSRPFHFFLLLRVLAAGETVKGEWVTAVPPGVVTVIGPDVAPDGTVAQT
jgi:hypothetical protein